MSRVIKSKFVQLFESVFLAFKEGYFLLALIFLSMFLLSSCDSKTEKEFSKVELTPEANELVKNLLKDTHVLYVEPFNEKQKLNDQSGEYIHIEPSQSGIQFKNMWSPDPKYKGQLGNSFIAAGVAIGDFNNDGLQDVYLARQQDGGKLFQNLGGFTFKDVTKSVGIKSEPFWSTGVSFIDINLSLIHI